MATGDTGVGPLLRKWRQRRGLSQLELASRSGSAARHISFVETGRSRPSEEMVLRLSEHLDVPLRERNALLYAAGYAPRYADAPLTAPGMAPVREQLRHLLAAHEPYPALVVDAGYDVVASNRGVALFLAGVDPALLEPSPNAMRLTLHPAGMAPRIRNLRAWRGHLLHQMQRQLATVRSPRLGALYDEVAAYPVPERDDHDDDQDDGSPFALTLVLDHEGEDLTFLSVITTFNTPADVTVSELALETFLPADLRTEKRLRLLAG